MNAVPQPSLDNASVTILCVDDEANILSALRRLFKPMGYQVVTAMSGAEGLRILDEKAIDLVISDDFVHYAEKIGAVDVDAVFDQTLAFVMRAQTEAGGSESQTKAAKDEANDHFDLHASTLLARSCIATRSV